MTGITVTTCLTGTIFKDISTFLSKKIVYAQSRDILDDPKRMKCSAHNFVEFFWYQPEVSIFKNGREMANLINSTFCDITKFKFLMRNLYPPKMQSFINLGRKIYFF